MLIIAREMGWDERRRRRQREEMRGEGGDEGKR